MQIGIDSFVINTPNPATSNGITAERMSNLLRSIELIGRQVMPLVNSASRAA